MEHIYGTRQELVQFIGEQTRPDDLPVVLAHLLAASVMSRK